MEFAPYLKLQKQPKILPNYIRLSPTMEDPITLHSISQFLLNSETFLQKLADKLAPAHKSSGQSSQQDLDQLIDQISYLLEQLIEKKLENQMAALVQDNNRILEEIRFCVERKDGGSGAKAIEGAGSFDTSFTEIHNIISEEKKKAFDRMTDAELEKSISFMERYEDVVEKVNEIQKKVRALQDRYETNFKSLWNVLSMTQSAVFDHIKENKKIVKKVEGKETVGRESFLSAFWK